LTGNTRYIHLTDEELIIAYRKSNDNEWLGHLLHRYTALLFGVAMKYLKDKIPAEDAVQQVFLKALTHLPKEDILNFKGWLYILMRNHCLQQLRDKAINTDDAALGNIAVHTHESEELLQHEYTLQQMEECLELLNTEQRTTITLFYLQKQSYEQIITQTGYTFMQVKSFIQNGKRNLKAILIKKLGQH
jgi:RNA polymerase sigma factor (sigma-70 family)